MHVADTRIFARRIEGEQILVYAMAISSVDDVAMILPLPVETGAGEAALSFVDLSGYPRFFDDLGQAFQLSVAPLARSQGWVASQQPRLVVHQVGAFVASFVPTLADFDRLDPRFRLPSEVFEKVPQYADHGFAVFQLEKGTKKRFHPMAFRFKSRFSDRLFFPTLHVHDGHMNERARFDHQLYYQGNGDLGEPSLGKLGLFMDASKCRDLVELGVGARRITMSGRFANQDTWVELRGE